MADRPPDVDEVEYIAKVLENVSDLDLAGSREYPARQEMQRRALNATRELTTAVRAFGDCPATQNAQMLKLTISIRTLTWVVIGLAVVQIGIAILTRGG